jgi:hypothetical protein
MYDVNMFVSITASLLEDQGCRFVVAELHNQVEERCSI